jgi:hypothetical protein
LARSLRLEPARLAFAFVAIGERDISSRDMT